jgi:hypothetical protein
LRKVYDKEFQDLKTAHKNEIDSLKTEYQNEIDAIGRRTLEEMERLKEDCEDRIGLVRRDANAKRLKTEARKISLLPSKT